MKGRSLLLIPLALATMACGYALVGRGSNIPEDVQIVYPEPLENQTRRPQVEQILNQTIADEIVLRGRFDLANGEEGADGAHRAGGQHGRGVPGVHRDARPGARHYQRRGGAAQHEPHQLRMQHGG